MHAVVSIPPLQEVVRRVLPEGSEVKVLVGPGSSPHHYALTPSDLTSIDSADLIVMVGLGLEGQAGDLLRREGPDKVIEFASHAGLESSHQASESCELEHDHSDPHLWLDPDLMIKLVQALGEHLAAAGDEEAPDRAARVVEEIRDADARAKAALAPFKGARLLTQHDGWRRFADHFGFVILGSVLPTGGGAPTPADLSRAVDAVEAARKASRAPLAIVTEPQLNARAARRLSDRLGVPMGMLDPLGDGDWFELLEDNTQRLVDVLSTEQAPE